MGTFASISTPYSETNSLIQITEKTISVFRQIEYDLSTYRSNSILSVINRRAGSNIHTPVPEYFGELHTLSRQIFNASDNTFDPTIGPLMKIWGFRTENPTSLPSSESIRSAAAKVDYAKVSFTNKNSVYLPLPGMQLDYGGIAKGYAVDAAFKEIPSECRDCLINLAGNMRAKGEGRKHAGGWNIAVRNPFQIDSNLGTFLLSQGRAVATSGNYERFIVINKECYTHIIDPRTGMPTKGIAGVTVIADSAALADGLSTALFILGPEKFSPLRQKYPGADILFITDSQPPELICTEGFADIFTPAAPSVPKLKIVRKQ